MANTTVITPIMNGPKHLILHVYVRSDGLSGEIKNLVVADPKDYGRKGPSFAIDNITWGFNGFTGRLKFDYLAEGTLVWILPNSADGDVDFREYGDLADRSPVLDASGKVLFSTLGFGDLGDEGSLIIKLRKMTETRLQAN